MPNNGKSPDTAVKEANFAAAGKESFQFSSHPCRNSADQNPRKQQGRGELAGASFSSGANSP